MVEPRQSSRGPVTEYDDWAARWLYAGMPERQPPPSTPARSNGLCVDCGYEIDAARLRAKPAATRCIICQMDYANRVSRAKYGRG
ncbi:MAG TPA: TraR/DksA C4-type zinc finger protein [Phycisphaerae bacterium]|nr:TraR/DksA C4-type zinc finger protein [Phycisphaerae bacterium]